MSSNIWDSSSLAWVIDENKHLLFASESFCRHFGIDANECVGKKITTIIPSAVSRDLFEKYIDAVQSDQMLETTQQIKWSDGNQLIFYINVFPFQTISGKKLLGGQAINIPDIYRLEKELTHARERLLNLSQATSDAVWEWDMQSGQIFRNDVLMEMIGYQWDNSKGLSWWLRRIHPDDRDRVGDKVKEATDQHQRSWEDEYRFKCADGKYKHIRDKGFIIYENGLPVKMIGSLQDISRLIQLQDELDSERIQRQKEIAETVISVQEKEKTKIGHELHDNVNQILATARLFIDKIKTDDPEQQQLKDKSTTYLVTAIEEIRKLSKELVAPQLKEQSLINNIKILISDIQLAGGITIHFSYDAQADNISAGKKITLFRIVQEQLKNILKHSKATVTHIVLEIREGNAELVIRDNGNGFDPAQISQGIGFSNIKERTLFYNGKVNMETAPGNGCTLSVIIPAID